MPTPVNVITGALGSGKTTTILALLRHKPVEQRWAVLVNEAGRVGIDGAMLEGLAAGEGAASVAGGALGSAAAGSVVIREVPGGCMCCVAGLPSQLALVELLRRAKPDRLLVEPTGLGHPAAILDQIRALGDSVELRATIALVDPRNLADPRFLEHETFEDQAQLADVLVATHDDVVNDDERARFVAWAESFFPAKSGVLRIAEGALDPAWLDAPRAARAARHPEAHRASGSSAEPEHGHVHAHAHDHAHDHDHDHDHVHDHAHAHDHDRDHDHDHDYDYDHDHDYDHDYDHDHARDHAHDHAHAHVPETLPEPSLGAPLRLASEGLGHATCGWLFHRDEVFDEDALVALFRRRDLPARAKGVLRVSSGPASGDVPYLAFNRSGDGLRVRPIAYRGESRVELIARDEEAQPWDEVERALLAARRASR